MASAKVKSIHLIIYKVHFGAHAVCDRYIEIVPIEATIRAYEGHNDPKGTFNPKKVTCKRCLKTSDYKTALDKINNPLFYWRENR